MVRSRQSRTVQIDGNMRYNGHLQYRIASSSADGDFDDDGMPIKAGSTDQWSGKVECFIKTNTHNVNGTATDGKFTVQAYEVLAERDSVPADTGYVKLERGSKDLGEFEVQDLQEISLDRIKIIV